MVVAMAESVLEIGVCVTVSCSKHLNKVIVETPFGTSSQFELNKIVIQETVFRSIKCSIQIDTLGRNCLPCKW